MEGEIVPPVQGQAVADNTEVEYATFLERFLAILIDAVLLGFVGGFLGMFFGNFNGESGFYSPFSSVIGWVYFVFMDVKYGGTVGKMVLGLRVQDAVTGNNVDWIQAILREIVGKFISGLVLALGYFAVIWDKNRQGWHDKIAKTVVVKKAK